MQVKIKSIKGNNIMRKYAKKYMEIVMKLTERSNILIQSLQLKKGLLKRRTQCVNSNNAAGSDLIFDNWVFQGITPVSIDPLPQVPKTWSQQNVPVKMHLCQKNKYVKKKQFEAALCQNIRNLGKKLGNTRVTQSVSKYGGKS